MNLGRMILTVSLLLTLASCSGTAVRKETLTGTDAGGAAPSATQGQVSTPVAKVRPVQPGNPASTQSISSASTGDGQATGTTRNAASSGASAGSIKQQGSKTVADEHSGTATSNASSSEAGGIASAGSTKQPGSKTGADDQSGAATGSAAPSGAGGIAAGGSAKQQDGTKNGAVTAATTGEPDASGQVAGLESSPASPQTVEGAGDAIEAPGPPSFEEKSLNCDVIEIMGKAIGQRRSRGEEQKIATDEAIDEVVRQTGEARDKRFVFSGRVYGMLIYNLQKDHTAEGFGSYVYSACLILRGRKALFIPADKASMARLDQGLRTCEAGSPPIGVLNACITEQMEEVVLQRGAVAE